MIAVRMTLDLHALNGSDLTTEELGAAVHAEMRRQGYSFELPKPTLKHPKPKGIWATPRIKSDSPFWPYRYELDVYCLLTCSRCAGQRPNEGLVLAYWGDWHCSTCAHELARRGGLLDQRGWPPINGGAAA